MRLNYCRYILISLSLVFILLLFLQAAMVLAQNEELFQDFKWRNIGPANMGGRISDIQALESDYRYVIAASASGGVWKSTNAGTGVFRLTLNAKGKVYTSYLTIREDPLLKK